MAWLLIPWIVFLGCVFAAGYVMAGYPLLLAWLARRHPRPVRKSAAHRPAVSVILAVHNGGAFLQQKLDSLRGCGYPLERLEIIVASDGSTDGTEAIAEAYGDRGVRLLRLPRGGKPAALNAAVAEASHAVLVFTDVRQTLAAGAIGHLMDCLADPEVGVASGYLVIRRGTQEEDNVGLYWRYERWIRSNLSAMDSMLGATGAFYAMRRELFDPMPVDLLVDDMYLPLQAFFRRSAEAPRGFRLILEPQAAIYDIPTGVEAEFRRKVRTLAGNFQIFSHFPQLFTWRNRLWWHFLSYKFGRLLLPWLFLGALLASLWLPEPWRTLVLIPQVALYALAALDPVAAGVVKKLTSPARTVVGMLAATACAITILFVPASSFWKTASSERAPGQQRGSA